jgi:glycosyltransferase involved in cell wall biosynthesis
MYGGGQKVALDLCAGLRELCETGVEMGMLGCTVEQLRSHSAFVVPYDGNYASPWSLASTTYRLRNVLRKRGYDFVHSHGWDADILAHEAIRGLGATHVIHLHVAPQWIHSSAMKHRVRRAMTRRMFSAHEVEILAVSHAVKDHWGRVFAESARTAQVIHNGVDAECFRPPDSRRHRDGQTRDEFVLGTAGRLAPQKGLTYLLDALPTVIARSRKPIRLDVAGCGSQGAHLEARSARLGIRKCVRFLGSVSNMPDFYRSIDAFVLPSLSEGLPGVVLEAMATSLPIVATDVGGTKEAVTDRIDGRIVPPRDPEALAAALSEIISDDSLRERMAASARARVCQAFSIHAQVEKIHALYVEALAARRRLPEARKTASVAAKI